MNRCGSLLPYFQHYHVKVPFSKITAIYYLVNLSEGATLSAFPIAIWGIPSESGGIVSIFATIDDSNQLSEQA